MDVLNQALRKFSAKWRGSSALGRAALIGAALAVLALLGYLNRPSRAGTETWLFGGSEFPAADLARMEAAFGKARLAGARVDGQRIAVPAAQKDLYLKALVDQQALPETFYSAQQRALDRDHPFTSQRQRDNWMKLAREQEIALIVRKIKGIEEVCVQYEDSETDSFARRKKRRATVAVRAAEGRPVESETVRAIRATVMNAVGVTEASDITVLDLNVGRAYAGGEENVRQLEHDYVAAKQRYEEQFRARVAERLTMYPGIVVTTNVELERLADQPESTGAFLPRHVTASIAIPRDTIVDQWRRARPEFGPRASRVPSAFELRRIEEETRRQIETLAAACLPSATETPAIVVTFVETAGMREVPVAMAEQPWHVALVDKEWYIAGGIVLLLGVGWHWSRTSRRDEFERGVEPPPVAREAWRSAHAERRAPHDYPVSPLDAPSATRLDHLREQLQDRVKDDPRSAGAALKQWLGKPASTTR